MRLIRNNKVYNLDKLREDKKFVEERFKYEDGAYGHCISLPSIYDLKEPYKSDYNNVPLRGVLGDTPYFKEIFDSFETEIAGFILQRRRPYSSYGLHEDAAVRMDLADHRLPADRGDAGSGRRGDHDAHRPSLRHQLLQRRRRR